MQCPAARFLLPAVIALAAACGSPDWREIDVPDGGFRIQMQGAPQVQKNDLPTPLGPVHTEWYSVEAADGAYGVGYADYPVATIRQTEPRKLFATVRESWLKRISGSLHGDGTDILLENKYPGMEVIASGKLDGRDAYLRGRFYLVGNRLYQVVAFGNKTVMPVSEINQFLSSFRLVARRDAPTTVPVDTGKINKE